ncbi:hypothetical protein VKT23_009886 [Stygiomarasmius scandens]|uniref:Uncharacterized protein n=1 Tax=Marasmiellus scandens TaxID=2682957 RepID=A0ABR1JEF8_9AGAR
MPASPSTAYVRSSYRPSLGLPSLPLRSEGAAARLGFYESLRLGTHLPGSSTPGSRFSVSDHGDSLRLSGVLAGFDPTGQKDNVTAEKHNLGWKLLKPFHRKHGKDMHEMVSTAENSVSVQNGFTSLPPRHGMEVEDRHVLDAVIRSSDIYREGDFGHEREMRNPASVSQTPPTSESQLDVIYQTPPAFPAPVHHQPGLIIPPPRQRPRIPEAFRLNLEQRSWPDVEASQLGTLEKGKSRSSPSMSSGYIADNGPFSCNGSSSPNLVMGMRHPDTILSRTQPALGARTRGQELRNDTGSSTSQHDDMNDWMPLDGTGDQYKGTAGTSLVALAADADSRFDELDLESTTKEAYLDQYIARFYENRRYGQCGLEEQL